MFKGAKAVFLGTLLATGSLYAFEEAPWFGNLWEFKADFDYQFSHYSEIEGSINTGKKSSNDSLVTLGLGAYFGSVLSDEIQPSWNGQLELEIAKTTDRDLNARSLGLMVRKLLLDDIAGDAVSLDIGVSVRYVPKSTLNDPSNPYHGSGNFELSVAVGKEISRGNEWLIHPYALTAFGFSGRKSCWNRTDLVARINCSETFDLELAAKGYFGLGGGAAVNLATFDGWSGIKHRSIDLALTGSYKVPYAGSINLGVSRRIYAVSYPDNAYAVNLSYTLPFSPF